MNHNVTAAILVVLGIGVFFTFTQDVLDQIKAVQKVNDQYTSAVASAEQLIKVRDKVLKEYNDISQEDRDRLKKIIPNTVDNIRLIIDLNSIALKHGFSLRNIKASASTDAQKQTPVAPANSGPQNTISTPTLDTVKVSFGVSAPYQQFIGFLQDLEASLRIMDITHLSVTANDAGLYDYNVEIKTYWLRQQ